MPEIDNSVYCFALVLNLLALNCLHYVEFSLSTRVVGRGVCTPCGKNIQI